MRQAFSYDLSQNFADATNFDDVWLKTRSGRKKMACKFLRELEVPTSGAPLIVCTVSYVAYNTQHDTRL